MNFSKFLKKKCLLITKCAKIGAKCNVKIFNEDKFVDNEDNGGNY